MFCPPVHVNQDTVPQTDTVKYLGLHFDKRLTWRENVTKTRKHLDLRTRELIWLIGKRSPLSLTNKILIYKTVLKPIWTYGLALWGCTAASNLAVIQRYKRRLSVKSPTPHGMSQTTPYIQTYTSSQSERFSRNSPKLITQHCNHTPTPL